MIPIDLSVAAQRRGLTLPDLSWQELEVSSGARLEPEPIFLDSDAVFSGYIFTPTIPLPLQALKLSFVSNFLLEGCFFLGQLADS